MNASQISFLVLVLCACSSGGSATSDGAGSPGVDGGSKGNGASSSGASGGGGSTSSSSSGGGVGGSGGSSDSGGSDGGDGATGGEDAASTDGAAGGVLDAAPDVVAVGADGGISVPSGYTGAPYGGTPQTIPGVISAVKYDVGGNNVAFSYKGNATTCAQRTTGDCIGIAGFGNGQVTINDTPEPSTQSYVGWTQTGEWLDYTVRVTEPGTFAIGAHVSAGMAGAKVSFSFTPSITTGPLTVPTTAGHVPGVEVYHVWERLDDMATVTLPAGLSVLTFKIDAVAGMNLESFTFTKR